MEEKEPKIRIYSDKEKKEAAEELWNAGISPIQENIDTYISLKETQQRPKGNEDIYDNIHNPEKLQNAMQQKKISSLIHIEWPDVWSHTKLWLQILEQEEWAKEEKKILQQIIFHHDLGKHEVVKNEINTTQTIKTIHSWRLFQTMIGHATAALEQTRKKLKANQLNDEEIELCIKIIENHMETDVLQRKNPEKIVALFSKFGENEEKIKTGIYYLTRMLHIDYLSTENIILRDNKLEYSTKSKKSEFTFERVREKYMTAKKEIMDIHKKEKNLQEKMRDCHIYLPQIAKKIIPDTMENTSFRENPDDPKEHQPQWHEFGIITHTKKTVEHFFKRNNRLKPIREQVDAVLQETIDDKTKEELMAISIVFHDIGKFLREVEIKDGEKIITHPDHEKIGKNIFMENKSIHPLIKKHYNLTEKQMIYIADCIGLHYELSKIRNAVKTNEKWYNLQYVHSEEFKHECEKIRNTNPEYQTEIGVLYLCDSLGKTDITTYGRNDEDLEKSKEMIKKLLEEKNMSPHFIDAAMQKPINIAIAKKYLEYIFLPTTQKQ